MKRNIINEVFVGRCNILKAEKNVSLEVIEDAIGSSKGSLSKYLNGIHVPNSEIVRKLAKYFNVSSDYLLGSSDARSLDYSDGKSIPVGYIQIITDAIKNDITEDEFRSLLDTAIKFKRRS